MRADQAGNRKGEGQGGAALMQSRSVHEERALARGADFGRPALDASRSWKVHARGRGRCPGCASWSSTARRDADRRASSFAGNGARAAGETALPSERSEGGARLVPGSAHARGTEETAKRSSDVGRGLRAALAS